jgi:hypothetical protein
MSTIRKIGPMRKFEIKCIEKSQLTANGHQHLTHVGIGNNLYPVGGIIKLLEGHDDYSFYTVSPTTGRIAEVSPFPCHCGLMTLRSHSDGIWDDNLDSLSSCALAA